MIGFYFDEMMIRAVVTELKQKGYLVVLANDVGMTQKDDEEHLRYATEHNLVMVTQDRKFAGQTQKHSDHAGLICWTDHRQDVGTMVRVLSAFADQYTPEQVAGRVFWLKG
jgi:predicted nuclease of predicted toxin-antitoxin system